jgi:hypothetical protein
MLSRRVLLRRLAAVAAWPIIASHKPNHGGPPMGHARVTWAEFQIAVGGGSGGAFQLGAFQADAFQIG